MFAVGCSLCKLRPEGQEFTPTHIVGRLCETPVQEDRPAERLPYNFFPSSFAGQARRLPGHKRRPGTRLLAITKNCAPN